MEKTKVYIMTHKSFNPPSTEVYKPLQVGHAISEDLGYLCDDVGENISAKNKSYCELTGIYWAWKHSDVDVIGICHYRRYFFKEGHIINEEEINEALNNYDCIVGNSSTTAFGSLWEHYSNVHFEKDMVVCRDVISEICPEYLSSFDTCMKCNFFTIGNMMITSKSIFDDYCSWLFEILFEIEERIDISDYDAFQYRVFGYLAERLLRVWLMNHTYRVCEMEVRMVEG